MPDTGAPGPSDSKKPRAEDLSALVDSILESPQYLTAKDVAQQAGVSHADSRGYWRALGFPYAEPGERSFTDADVIALRQLKDLADADGLGHEASVAIVRSAGRTVHRLATWQVEILLAVLDERPDLSAHSVDKLIGNVVDALEPLIIYSWRRHLAEVVGNQAEQLYERASYAERSETIVFADLVGFTEIVRQLPGDQIARLVETFEAVVVDLVTSRGGQVIKTVGDEVLYSLPAATDAVCVATDIAAAIADIPDLPDVRIGAATGSVVHRHGDVYGPVVNLASRLRAKAEPQECLVDGPTASYLLEFSDFDVSQPRLLDLRGIGKQMAYAVRRADAIQGR